MVEQRIKQRRSGNDRRIYKYCKNYNGHERRKKWNRRTNHDRRSSNINTT